jgi:hypothetical protein
MALTRERGLSLAVSGGLLPLLGRAVVEPTTMKPGQKADSALV